MLIFCDLIDSINLPNQSTCQIIKALSVNSPVSIFDKELSIIAVMPGSLTALGTADINALPVSLDITCFFLTVKKLRLFNKSIILALVASVPMPSFPFRIFLRFESVTNKCAFSMVAISVPSVYLNGGFVCLVSISTASTLNSCPCANFGTVPCFNSA